MAALLLAGGCKPAKDTKAGVEAPVAAPRDEHEGRLRARPGRPTVEAPERGLRPLGLGGQRDGLLYVPASYRADRPAPLVVVLHGSRSGAREGLGPWLKLADEAGLLLLAPESRGRTWDIVLLDGGYGPDVPFIDRALAHVFERYAVEPKRLALAGFSDGASFALSLGLTNGDLFTHVVAFSPGFLEPAAQRGKPGVFLSHGREDTVLPIGPCSRSILPLLKDAGHAVRYREFEGAHEVPPGIAREALAWFTAP